jgi:hypothetical protein
LRIHVIACRVLTRELCALAADCENTLEFTWLPQGLHDSPDELRRRVQEAIWNVDVAAESGACKRRPDVIVLGYGLCGNGIIGLRAGKLPLIIPRTDDCIAQFLGSQERYLTLFQKHPGVYWLNSGWLEQSQPPTEQAFLEKERFYREQYGEDNGAYLAQQDRLWAERYHSCGFIRSPVFRCARLEEEAREIARFQRWEFFTEEGDLTLLCDLLAGHWEEKRFLTCPPGYKIAPAYDGSKMTAVKEDD